jgi:GSCFA family
MNFHSELTPKSFSIKMKHTDKLLLVGSCFTEQIGRKLAAHKFDVLENPNGILFNPISIAKAVMSYAKEKLYSEEELFYYNELWASREHHTQFSNIEKATALKNINESQQKAIDFIKTADWILLTLGSAFVYEWKDIDAKENYENVAANCHKIPTDKFNRQLTEPEKIKTILQKMEATVRAINPTVKFIYTISPVRHLREGFVENNRSKATLIQAVHALTNDSNIFYFPAYELVIDDLRDYRFFAEDLVHPNYAATNYVWEKFVPTVIDEPSQELMKEINEINAAISHKAFNPASEAHKKFLKSNLIKVQNLQVQNPYLNFEIEAAFFVG